MTLALVVDNVPVRRPRAPATLGAVGQKEWRRICASLSAAGTLSDDRLALVLAYCEAVEGAFECAKIIKKQGRIIVQKDGPPKAHPAVRQHLQYQAQVLRLAEKLGIVNGFDPKQRKVDGPSAPLDY